MVVEPGRRSPLAAPLKALFYVGFAAFFFVFGYTLGETPGAPSWGKDGQVTGQREDAPEWLSGDVDFDLFWEVWDLVRSEYVEQDVPDKQLFYGALKGLLGGLEDPYSSFFTPRMAEEFSQELAGTFFGIGAEIGLDENGNIVVIAPLPDTPAERAGILAGDRILFVGNTDTTGLTVNEAVQLIRGEKGTEVVLTLSRDNSEPFEVPITRDEITIKSVTWELRDDGIGVITVSMFNDDTAALFREASQELIGDGMTSLIVDLRNNPGGLLDSAIDLAGYWVGDDVVVIESTGDDRLELKADGVPWFSETKTVVLVNGGSASASEILAGALQDYDLAEVIGEQTFGKGSVQTYHELSEGSAVKITVAKWLTPLGRSIDQDGITPDMVVSLTQEDFNANKDPQLEAAINFLQTQ